MTALDNIKNRLAYDAVADAVDIDKIPLAERTIKEITDAVDNVDLKFQTDAYVQAIQLNGTSMAEGLEHKAYLMQKSAETFLKRAAQIRRDVDGLCKIALKFSDLSIEIDRLLDSVAHFEPERVTNNGGG